MAHDQDRLLLAVPFDAGDQVAASGVEREDLGRDALGFEDFFQVFHSLGLIPWRVAGVEADYGLEVAEGFGFQLVPIDRGFGSEEAGDTGDNKQERKDSECGHEKY